MMLTLFGFVCIFVRGPFVKAADLAQSVPEWNTVPAQKVIAAAPRFGTPLHWSAAQAQAVAQRHKVNAGETGPLCFEAEGRIVSAADVAGWLQRFHPALATVDVLDTIPLVPRQEPVAASVVGMRTNEITFALLWPEFRLRVRTVVRLRQPGAAVRAELAAGTVLSPEVIMEVHDGSLLLDRTYVPATELTGKHLRRVVKPGAVIRRSWVTEPAHPIDDTPVTALITVGAAQIKAPARWVRPPDEQGNGLVRLEGRPKILRASRTAEGAEIRVP